MSTSIPSFQKSIHTWAVSKEWRGPNAETQRTTGDDIALMHSEASEALEAFRECNDPLAVWHTFTVEVNGVKFKDLTEEQLAVILDVEPIDLDEAIEDLNLVPKPEGVGPELADLLIRIFDYAEHVGLDMEAEVVRKMAHNESREIRHGGKHL